jgi:FixJ family two-component response regulator
MTTQPLVFLVDDDDAVRDSLTLLLETAGLAVEAYSSAENFLGAYRPERPGCLVLDVNMPGIDGYEVCRRMRGMRHLDRVPIAFITSNRTAADLTRAREVGGNDFIVKPFTIQKLQDRVRHWVSRRVG